MAGPQPRLVAGFEGLDGDHPPAAARTSVPLAAFVKIFGAVAVRAGRRRVGYTEEPAGQCNVVRPVGIGKKAVVTDAVKSVGQHVDQEATDELVGVERHQLVAGVALGPVILPFEGDALAVEGDEPAIGNSNPVRVARKVGEDSVGSAKRPLGIDHPFAISQGGEACLEGCRLGEGGLVGEEVQPPGLVRVSLSRNRRRKRRESTRTERKKPGRQVIQRWRSGEKPPPGTMIWACGWWVSADPQVWRTEVSPMRAPRCLGSAAMVIKVSAAVLSNRS